MTRPLPDWTTARRVTDSVSIAEGRLLGVGHPDFPLGCGESTKLWKHDYVAEAKKKQQEKTRKEYNRLLSLEERLKTLPFRHEENRLEFARLLENMQSRKSQEGTNSNE